MSYENEDESLLSEEPLPERLEAAVEEFLLKRGMIDVSDWLHRYPDYMPELLQFLGDEAQLNQLVGDLRADNSVPVCRIGDYELLEIIDRGGMGIVYKARHVPTNQLVALKMIQAGQNSSPEARRRFRNEAELALSLQHPNLVKILEVGEHNQIPFFSMEFIQGRNLADLRSQGKILPRAVARVMKSIAEAIQYIHEQSIIHRDLKPSNIMLTEDFQVRVTDFGLAKRLDQTETLTRTGQILGTIVYMPPEQAEARHSEVGITSDVYSLGAIMYELLTGKPPVTGASSLEIIRRIREDKPEPPQTYNSSVPESLSAICLRCLEKEPSKRFPSARALARELQKFLDDKTYQPRERWAGINSVRPGGVFWKRVGLVAVVASLLVAAFVAGRLFDTYSDSGSQELVSQSTDDNATRDPEKQETREPVFNPVTLVNEGTGGVPGAGGGSATVGESGTVASKEPENSVPGEVAGNQEAVESREVNQPIVNQPAVVQPAVEEPEFRVSRAFGIEGPEYGVAEIRIEPRADSKWRYFSDIPIRLISGTGRSLYAAHASFAIGDRRLEGEAKEGLSVLFLYRGEIPRAIRVVSGDVVLAEGVELVVEDQTRYRERLSTWWTRFNRQPMAQTSSELLELNHAFAEILSHRLGLTLPPPIQRNDGAQALEKEFERTVGMMLGFESIRLAMMEDQTVGVSSIGQSADQPLPQPATIPRVTLPRGAKLRRPEPMALRVPEECFYLRCREVRNYRWIRQLVTGWGGDLDGIVATASIDHQIRERLEHQIGLSTEDLVTANIDNFLSDCALIGLDPFFMEGAAVGVLIEATDNDAVTAIIQQQRNQAMQRHGLVADVNVFDDEGISRLESEDGQIRSFYVTVDNYHLVTNSERLAQRFLETRSGQSSIGELVDYQHAKAELWAEENCISWLYLSDPFFRYITSPACRIELMRRRASAHKLMVLTAARMMAEAEGLTINTINDLREAGFLAAGFGRRPDDSQLTLVDGRPRDTLRGVPGTFRPIADLDVRLCTVSEANAYEQFRQDYRAEWPSMDPVLVSFGRNPYPEPGVESISLNIRITPYAQQQYQVLRQNLAEEPVSKRVAMMRGELLGVSGRLQTDGGPAWMHLGVMDADVEYQILEGEIQRQGENRRRTYAENQSFAMLDQAGEAGFQQLVSIVSSLQSKSKAQRAPSAVAERRSTSPGAGGPFMYLIQLFSGVPLSVESFLRAQSQSDARKTVLSFNEQLRRSALREMKTENTDRAAQMFMELRDVHSARVYPYLRASTYVSSRRASAADTAALNRMLDMLNIADPQKLRMDVEDAISGVLLCPIGGHYVQEETVNRPGYWVSNAWQAPSFRQESAVPETYDFPFLTWLRSMELECTLSRTTLHSRMNMIVRPPATMKYSPKVILLGSDEVEGAR